MTNPIQVSCTEVREDRYFARLRGTDLERIIAAAVAAAAGVDLGANGVKIERCWVTRRDTGSGGEPEAEVLIVVSREPAGAGQKSEG